ncbi:PepSY domain-containing protein [Mesorhizobium marinum]|uniref:PepSY domain-containing protein n=1 Tax=Mesorhizobium marinum TaxID=3228790 RepID=A0ABV3QWR1_9HYPH
MTNNTLIGLIFAAGVVGAAMPAYAEGGSDESTETLALQAAKLTAEDALKAATAKVPGTVSSVEIYDDAGKPAFHVEIVGADGRQQDVSVDAMSGEVMKMAANEDDEERHDEDKNDEGDDED